MRGRDISFDFSVNVNPLGMPEAARTALLSDWKIYEEYPDDGYKELREALAARFDVKKAQIVCGNGASDLIYRLCLCGGFRKVLLPVPSFTEYQRALEMAGCEIRYFYTEEHCGFVPDERILEPITPDLDALFLCNPGNPAGGLISGELMKKISERCRQASVMLISDECFLDFVQGAENASALGCLREEAEKNSGEGGGIAVIRAFTKIFAMAGLRLGFAVFSSEETARKVYGWGAPWQVSGPAQAAALAILGAGGGSDGISCGDGSCGYPAETEWDFYIEKTKSYIADQRFFMEGELKKLGFSTVPGCANYILFRGPEDLGGRLAKRGFSIRDCSDYRGLKIDRENMERSAAAQKGAGGKTAGERYYRIAVKKERENRLLLQEMERYAKWL